MRPRSPLVRTVVVVALYSVAMAYLEAAVVVYLRGALGLLPSSVFPADLSGSAGQLGWIELGRELATLVMIGTVGWIAGRSPLERLAWAAVVFGIWDIGYYAWLWVFSGWPTGIDTWDLLFLLPVPWAGPVSAPILVSLALIGFGLAVVVRLRRGSPMLMGRRRFAALLLGGFVVILSFTLNAGVVLAGEIPTSFAWPVFLLGMGIGVLAAIGSFSATPR